MYPYSTATMLVEVRKTHDQGRRRSPIEIANDPPLVGELTLASVRYQSMGNVTSLSLQERGNQTREGHLADLYEPELVALVGPGMRFRGIEAIAGVGYVQEWLVDLVQR